MPEVYCGIGQMPKKMRLGSMKECAEKKQIRYYGVKKIDAKLLKLAQGKKEKKLTRDGAMLQLAKFRGKFKNLQGKLQATKKKEDKDEVQKEIANVKMEIKKWEEKFDELDEIFQKQKQLKKKKMSRSKDRKSVV